MPYPVSVQGEVAGRKTAVALKVTRDDKLVALQDIDVAFGSSDVKGTMDIRDAGPKSTWTVNLRSTALDLDDLPAPRAPCAAPAKAGGSGGGRRTSYSPMRRCRLTHCARTMRMAK